MTLITYPIVGNACENTVIECCFCGKRFPIDPQKEYEFSFSTIDDGLFGESEKFEYLIKLEEYCPHCEKLISTAGIPAENVKFQEFSWYEETF